MSTGKRLAVAAAIVAAGLVVSACGLLRGSEYPSADITYVVGWAPGGATDATSRKITQEAEPLIGRKFVVVNKAGAAGTIGTGEIIRSKPDGYTIGISSISTLAMQPQLGQVPYSGIEDSQPIVGMVDLPNATFVQAGAPWKSLEEFLADAKKRPGELRVGNTGQLGTGNLILHEIMAFAKVELVDVPFATGASEATTALLGGHIHALISEPGPMLSQVQAGKLRSLAIMQGGRMGSMSGVASAEEIGYKSTVPPASYMVIAPKGVDKAIVDKLTKVFTEAAKSPGFQKFADDNAMRLAVTSPEDVTKRTKDAWQVYAGILKGLNIEKK